MAATVVTTAATQSRYQDAPLPPGGLAKLQRPPSQWLCAICFVVNPLIRECDFVYKVTPNNYPASHDAASKPYLAQTPSPTPVACVRTLKIEGRFECKTKATIASWLAKHLTNMRFLLHPNTHSLVGRDRSNCRKVTWLSIFLIRRK